MRAAIGTQGDEAASPGLATCVKWSYPKLDFVSARALMHVDVCGAAGRDSSGIIRVHTASGARTRNRRPQPDGVSTMARRSDVMDTLVSLAKRRGLVYPSSEIYGGLRASWDYGPL